MSRTLIDGTSYNVGGGNKLACNYGYLQLMSGDRVLSQVLLSDLTGNYFYADVYFSKVGSYNGHPACVPASESDNLHLLIPFQFSMGMTYAQFLDSEFNKFPVSMLPFSIAFRNHDRDSYITDDSTQDEFMKFAKHYFINPSDNGYFKFLKPSSYDDAAAFCYSGDPIDCSDFRNSTFSKAVPSVCKGALMYLHRSGSTPSRIQANYAAIFNLNETIQKDKVFPFVLNTYF